MNEAQKIEVLEEKVKTLTKMVNSLLEELRINGNVVTCEECEKGRVLNEAFCVCKDGRVHDHTWYCADGTMKESENG